ncbi:MAG: tetratricopeptide repeat protein [Thaumarchaeota archaeon]|nr:MAG: tetratricopeptide repeat protein [Nitrososphaerota archaeon]
MESIHTLSLPIVNQENACLPLVINAVSKYWAVDLPLAEAIEIAKKYAGVKGSILIEGVELAERYGLSSAILNSSMRELRKMIDMGIPPIVILPGIRDVVQHASLIVGYDEMEKTIFHYIPEPDKIGAIPEEKFDQQWSEDDKLMILLFPSDIMSKIKFENKTKLESNRLCFNAEKLRLQGKVEDALHLLKRALEINPSNSTAACLVAGILNDTNSSDAIKYYKQSIELNPQCYLAYRGLGNYYIKIRDYKNAEKYYTAAVNINPQRFAPIYKNRAITRLEQKKSALAKEDFKKYLELLPDAPDAASIMQAIKES